jgi:hypothetical protein
MCSDAITSLLFTVGICALTITLFGCVGWICKKLG